MLLIDDLLLSPINGLLFIFKELAKRGEAELMNDEPVRRELREAYMLLETGRISEPEFERRENRLVLRLEEIERMRSEKR